MKTNRSGALVRLLLIVGLGVGVGIGLFARPSIAQDPSYHQFADQRSWLGVPNFANVVSNLPFLVIGVAGLWAVKWKAVFLDPRERRPYYALFAGIGLTAFGSAFYHWRPDNARLVWDRLPMTLAFMGLFSAMLAERVSLWVGIGLLPWLLLAGFGSVVYWHVTDDLRPYHLVQFGPMAAIPLMVIFFPGRYTGAGYLFLSLGCYVLAKFCEMRWDTTLYDEVGVSGHTIKHLLAALAAYCLLHMVWTRRPLQESKV